MKFHVFVFALCCVLFATGCNSGKVPVCGNVTFSDDQSPVTSGTVYFQTESYLARGALQADGSYVLGSEKAKDGLPPGTYRVYVQGALTEVGKTPGGEPVFESMLDDKYTDSVKSGLVFEAGKGDKRFDFQVDRKKTRKR